MVFLFSYLFINLLQLRKFRASLLGSVPEGLQQYVKLLLNTEPTVRPDPSQLMKVIIL